MGGSGGAAGAALAVVAPEAAGAVPDRVVAGEMPADEDAEAGAGAAARLFGQLEGHAIGGDDIVAAHDAFLLDAEHLLEIDAAERDKGGRRVGGRPAELVVEGGADHPWRQRPADVVDFLAYLVPDVRDALRRDTALEGDSDRCPPRKRVAGDVATYGVSWTFFSIFSVT